MWHQVEEIEHSAIAFDVYEQFHGDVLKIDHARMAKMFRIPAAP